MFRVYVRSVLREAFPKINSADLFYGSMKQLAALLGAATFPAINQWAQLVPGWVGAVPIVFYVFAWAPYRAWAKQTNALAGLNDQLSVGFNAKPSIVERFLPRSRRDPKR